MKKNVYKVQLFYGFPVEQDNNGKYFCSNDQIKLSVWRTGKHSTRHFQQIGQLFLTENNFFVVILKVEDINFNKRHAYTPLARFLNKKIDDSELNRLRKLLV